VRGWCPKGEQGIVQSARRPYIPMFQVSVGFLKPFQGENVQYPPCTLVGMNVTMLVAVPGLHLLSGTGAAAGTALAGTLVSWRMTSHHPEPDVHRQRILLVEVGRFHEACSGCEQQDQHPRPAIQRLRRSLRDLACVHPNICIGSGAHVLDRLPTGLYGRPLQSSSPRGQEHGQRATDFGTSPIITYPPRSTLNVSRHKGTTRSLTRCGGERRR
jgi:hypothetical protein